MRPALPRLSGRWTAPRLSGGCPAPRLSGGCPAPRLSGGCPAWAAPLAAAVLACAPLACLPGGARAEDTVRVITHTLEYCVELSIRARALGALARPPETALVQAEASQLVAEADRLCAQGQIRPGIIRLRRAIMLLRAQAAPEPAARMPGGR